MRAIPKNFLMGLLSLAVTCSAAAAESADKLAGAHYVNMGSSFAAGSGISPTKPGHAKRCQQSAVNYASLLAANLHLELDDVSCGGAKTVNLLQAWNELPPQLDSVTSNTRLVTITVGGNDLNYVMNLFAESSCSERGKFTIEGRDIPCFQKRPPAEEDYQKLQHNLREVATQISSRAPHAKIIFIQYVTLIPEELCEATPLSEQGAKELRLISARLAEITTATAKEFGAMVLNTDQLSVGHTACDADPWSMGASATTNNLGSSPWHPNRRGHEVIAEKLQQMLER